MPFSSHMGKINLPATRKRQHPMYKKILVPLDGSQLAESVLPYVSCLSEALRVPVELLHVQDPKQTTSFSRTSQEVDYLKNIASSMLASSTVRYTVKIGKPAEVIVNTASRDAGTLITMATYGRTSIQRWLFGSVASDVLYALKILWFSCMQPRKSRFLIPCK